MYQNQLIDKFFLNWTRFPTSKGLYPLHLLVRRKDISNHVTCLSLVMDAYPQALTHEINDWFISITIGGERPRYIDNVCSPYSIMMACRSDDVSSPTIIYNHLYVIIISFMPFLRFNEQCNGRWEISSRNEIIRVHFDSDCVFTLIVCHCVIILRVKSLSDISVSISMFIDTYCITFLIGQGRFKGSVKNG
jgi:hypothetical protein